MALDTKSYGDAHSYFIADGDVHYYFIADPKSDKIDHDIELKPYVPGPTDMLFTVTKGKRTKFLRALKAHFGHKVLKLTVIRPMARNEEHDHRVWVRFPVDDDFPPHSDVIFKMTFEFD